MPVCPPSIPLTPLLRVSALALRTCLASELPEPEPGDRSQAGPRPRAKPEAGENEQSAGGDLGTRGQGRGQAPHHQDHRGHGGGHQDDDMRMT